MIEARHGGGGRMAFGAPLGKAAVEHGNGVVPDPAQHPPQPRSGHAAAGVVAHHLVAGPDALLADPGEEGAEVGKRMAAITLGAHGREVVIEAGKQGARNVRLAVLLLAFFRIGEIEPAVDHDPARIGEARDERGGIDQGAVHAYGFNCSEIGRAHV